MTVEHEPFLALARRLGYAEAPVTAALQHVAAQLAARGLTSRRYCCFRTAGGGSGGGGSRSGGRPRTLLLFPSADDALSFAQRRGLGSAPRLVELSLGQALAILLQQPNMTALLIADGDDDAPTAALPAGLRLERATLLSMLAQPAR